MWRDLRWIAGRFLLTLLPVAIVLVALFEWGALRGAAFAVLGLALATVTISSLVWFRALRFVSQEAVADLGPHEAGGGAADPERRRSVYARVIRPAALRLDRAWRDHAAELQAKLAAAEAIVAAVPDPLILIDRQRRIVRTNAATAEFIGAGGEGRDLAAALRNPALLAAADAVLRGDGATSVEFTLSLPIERILRAHLAPVSGPADRGAAAILTLHEVTALKRSEQLRADFVANAGHELKTPLATLIGFIETLQGPAKDDAAARQRFLGIMQQQARRMARLVDDLLSLSRIELNEHVAPTGHVALAPLIDEVARGLELRAEERGIRIVQKLPADLPEVQGDRDELAQIAQNLLDNSVKYGRPHSEVTVTGGLGSGGAGMAPQVWLVVADRGEGIASEHLPRLTERFYRVDTARSRELGGTGLGLAIVKHILNRHRGRLDIRSIPGDGSTFTVWLRAAPSVIELQQD
jgi:two-component system phosphate regulon sensor histidine kinase PhoR